MSEPVFEEPWQAQAFALATALQESGHVTPKEWMDALAAQIAAARDRGEHDDGSRYYDYLLAALEKLVAEKCLVSQSELVRRKAEWDAAARATPHGQPIELKR